MKQFYEKCQIFTPSEIVVNMLDYINYSADSTTELFGKKIMENSCGDGQFLLEIVSRYIENCLNNNYSNDVIIKGIENDIYAVEIDNKHYLKCLENLEKIRVKYNLNPIKWNLFNEDSLRMETNDKFDFIVGNPPYITYSDLNLSNRNYIKDKFEGCKSGKPDYYYAFVEWSLNNLNEDGKMSYLIPNNIFKNRFGLKIRELILPYLIEIYDYDSLKIFDELTTSAIIILSRKDIQNYILYNNIETEDSYEVLKTSLSNKWVFQRKYNNNDRNRNRFGDYFKVSVSIATQLNDAFILKNYEMSENGNIIVNNHILEDEVLRPCASPRSLSRNKEEYIIFPYYYDSQGIFRRIGQNFEELYPNVTDYLRGYYDRLLDRQADDTALWFEYGRSQALMHLNQRKIWLSTLISNNVKAYLLDELTIPYSGIFITPINDLNLENAIQILESEDFLDYAKSIGIKSNSNSIRISPIDIREYMFINDY